MEVDTFIVIVSISLLVVGVVEVAASIILVKQLRDKRKKK